ncbi:MAG: DUF3084 domain-containing protein [bacterium]|nr:DUF3084 domain-containing protein [bacterium]
MHYKVLTIILVYLCVIVIAGGIAYFANRLGRHIGKRKMSIFHLRPRHTSILITTFTGAAIAVITLTVFAALSEPVRVLLGGLQDLRKEEASLRAKVDKLHAELEQGTFVWNVNDPIVHMTLPGGLSPDRVDAAITSLLAAANAKTILKNNDIAAEKKQSTLPADMIMIDCVSDIPKTAQALSNRNEVLGVRIKAEKNCLFGERAPVCIEYWDVKLIYHKDDIVNKTVFEPDESMLNYLKFIEDTRKKAADKGMITSDDGTMGDNFMDELSGIEKEIRSQTGKFELLAVANRDLYETSSLDVRIEVRPLNSNMQAQGDEL